MKLSEVKLSDVKDFCGVSGDDSDTLLDIAMSGARSYILNRTGLDEAAADELPDLTLAFMVLVNEMHTNRTYTIDGGSVNPFAEQILSLYNMNLL